MNNGLDTLTNLKFSGFHYTNRQKLHDCLTLKVCENAHSVELQNLSILSDTSAVVFSDTSFEMFKAIEKYILFVESQSTHQHQGAKLN